MKKTKNSQRLASTLLKKQPKQLDLFEWEKHKYTNERIKMYIEQHYRGENFNERETSNKLCTEIPGNSQPREL